MEKEILLTITMLVSDRTETIEKCMKSLKSLLERVSSELIVVDTARNKICLEIVKEYADKIIPFVWCNDFAKARNYAISKCKGHWIVFLDADEYLLNSCLKNLRPYIFTIFEYPNRFECIIDFIILFI